MSQSKLVRGGRARRAGFVEQLEARRMMAVAISSGQTLNGTIAQVGGLSTYTFSAKAGDSLTLTMGATGGSLRPWLQLYDPSSGFLANGLGGGQSALIESLVAPSTGTYTVVARDDAYVNTGSFALTFVRFPGTQAADSDGNGGTIAPGQTKTASINRFGDLDLFTFSASSGDTFTLEMKPGSPVEPAFDVRGPDGKLIASARGLYGATSGPHTAAATGTYTVVAHDDRNVITGSYTLKLTGTFKPTGGAGSIAGNLFNDLDSDGVKDSGEGALAGWKVFLDADKDGVLDSGEKTATTDASGNYKFNSLAAGSYRVREVTSSGWRRTSPTSGYFDVTVASGQNVTGKNFGNTQKVLISGSLFNDLDGDGVKDSGEGALAGWTVFLDSDKDGVQDSGEKTATTDSSGNYSFKTLAAGSYRVREVLKSGWRRTTPSSGYFDLTLSNGGSSTGKNFGNTQKILISGTVFNDLDGDKVKDSGEAGLSGWKVFIDADSDGVWDSNEKYVTTSSTGAWSFKNLAAGTYRVRVVQQTGWTRTTPTSGYHSVTLASGGSSTGKLFGEKK